MDTDKVGELETLLARLDERTDGDYLARLSNGVCIASECADFLREHGPELLRVYRAWQGAAVVEIELTLQDGHAVMYAEADNVPESLDSGTRVRLVPDDGQGA